MLAKSVLLSAYIAMRGVPCTRAVTARLAVRAATMHAATSSASAMLGGRAVAVRASIAGAIPVRTMSSTTAAAAGSPPAASLTPEGINKAVDAINEQFGEAREEISMAMESAGTVYFNDEATEATEIGEGVLTAYRSLLDSVSADKRGELQRSLGLKMEQLKAELKMLRDAGAD